MTSLVAFIIGSGANVGASVASLLKQKGYAVAVGSRNPDIALAKAQGYFPVSVDITKTDSVTSAFAQVNAGLGAPNVVIYNAALFSPPKVAGDPLTLPSDTFAQNVANGSGVFTAASAALAGFRSENHKASPKTFIVTGNILPFIPPSPQFFGLGTEKSISAYLVNVFSGAYGKEGIHFYYASLVSPEGGLPSTHGTSGTTHAKVYWKLINGKEQGRWDHRFTDDGEKLAKY